MQSIEISRLRSVKVSGESNSGNRQSILNKEFSLGGRKGLGNTQKERFYSELGMLLAAGVDIRSAMELVIAGQKKERDKQLLRGLLEDIVSGKSLSSAMEGSRLFSDYEKFSIRIGEESGRMNEILGELSRYYARSVRQRRQIISALSYPVMVLITAIGTILFMMSFIVPMFSDVFKRFGGDLPGITKAVLKISSAISGMAGPVFLIILGTGILLYFNRRTLWWQKTRAKILMRLPVFGPIVTRIYLARFCTSMHLLLSARTPLVQALDLAGNMVSFHPISSVLKSIREEVMKGTGLHTSMAKHPIFPAQLTSLVKVGEEVNRLDTIFGKLAAQYRDEIDHRTETLRSVIEPLLIIFIGSFVALILLAMYLPLFKLGGAMH